jgi:hypothetical protein
MSNFFGVILIAKCKLKKMKWDSFSLGRLLKGFSKIQDRSNSFSARNTILLPGAYAFSAKKNQIV